MTRQTPRDARHLTLGMDGAWDVFRKLEWEVATFLTMREQRLPPSEDGANQLRLPMYAAINAASTAWSLIEWLWFEMDQMPEREQMLASILPLKPNGGLPELKNAARTNREIDACYNIAHATKHRVLDRATPGLSAPLHFDFWLDRDGTPLMSMDGLVVTTDPQLPPMSVEQVLTGITEWWRSVLVNFAIPDQSHLAPPGTRHGCE